MRTIPFLARTRSRAQELRLVRQALQSRVKTSLLSHPVESIPPRGEKDNSPAVQRRETGRNGSSPGEKTGFLIKALQS